MEELFPKHLNDLDEIFSTLDDDDKECLLRLLKKLKRYGK
jgi:ABC-type Mn2+/Zn2+ transport system ATPase subunit